MQFYIDQHSWPLSGIWSAPTRSPILRFPFNRGSVPVIPVRFVASGVVVELGNTSAVGLGFKATPASASWLIAPAAAVKTGTGTATVYTLSPSLLSSALDTLLGGATSVAVYGELYWTDDGSGGTAGTFGDGSIQFLARIYQNLNTGSETVPGSVSLFTDIGTVAVPIATAATDTITGGGAISVVAGAGAGAYTRTIVLATAGVAAGALADVRIQLPASSNPTIQVRNATAIGTILLTVTGDPSGVRYINAIFRYTGTAWERWGGSDIV